MSVVFVYYKFGVKKYPQKVKATKTKLLGVRIFILLFLKMFLFFHFLD